jgi:hypothetical protein
MVFWDVARLSESVKKSLAVPLFPRFPKVSSRKIPHVWMTLSCTENHLVFLQEIEGNIIPQIQIVQSGSLVCAT